MLYEKVKEIAIEKDISINKIEKDLEFSSSYISKWKNSMPSATALKKVADYLEVSMEDLLSEREDE